MGRLPWCWLLALLLFVAGCSKPEPRKVTLEPGRIPPAPKKK
jgi:hypothetical protein